MTDDARDEEAQGRAKLEAEIELERTRQLILDRRNRFMAAALAGIGMATSACTRASVCLDVPVESGHGGTGEGGSGGKAGTRPSVCLSGSPAPEVCRDGSRPPCVCLSAPFDGSIEDDAGVDDAGT